MVVCDGRACRKREMDKRFDQQGDKSEVVGGEAGG